MEILEPLSKTLNANQYVVIMMDHYSMRMGAISTSKTTVSHIVFLFTNYWIMPYGIPTHVLTGNGTQFGREFFESLSPLLWMKHQTTIECHIETNREAERLDKKVIARLKHYVPQQQRDWEIYVEPLTYVYDAQVHRTTSLPKFSLVLSGPLDLQCSIVWLHYLLTPQGVHLPKV